MNILRFLTILFVTLFVAYNAAGQARGGYDDDANAAFREVVVLRQALIDKDAVITAQQGEIAALKEAKDAQARLVALLMANNETLKADNADLRKLKCDKTSFLFFLITVKRCK